DVQHVGVILDQRPGPHTDRTLAGPDDCVATFAGRRSERSKRRTRQNECADGGRAGGLHEITSGYRVELVHKISIKINWLRHLRYALHSSDRSTVLLSSSGTGELVQPSRTE